MSFSAKDTPALIEAFEAAVHNLFQIEHVLFFLPEKDGTILQGCASPSNKLHQSSGGLLLPLKRGATSVV